MDKNNGKSLSSIINKKNNNLNHFSPEKITNNNLKLYQPRSRNITKIDPKPQIIQQQDAWRRFSNVSEAPTVIDSESQIMQPQDTWRRLSVISEEPIVIGQDISRVIIERPERKWIKPVINNNYDKNSLTFIFTDIKNKIIEKKMRGAETKSANIFQQKLEKTFIAWSKMMDFILVKLLMLDNKYLSQNFFGFKELLIYNIMNISLSFIIIGATTKTGSGIDNLNGPSTTILENKKNKQLTIKQQISLFLELLPIAIEQISQNNKRILQLENEYTCYFQEYNNIIASIQIQKNEYLIQKNESDKQQNKSKTDHNKNNKIVLSPILVQINDMIKNLTDEQKNIENKIQNVDDKKIRLKNIINGKFCSLTNYIKFSYFMHDDWYPSLDSDLWPSFLNEAKPINY